MKKFAYNCVHEIDAGQFWFEAAMISTCRPVFDRFDSNYEVEGALLEAGVIQPEHGDQCDSETCALVVNFSSREQGEKFIDRLNEYLANKEP